MLTRCIFFHVQVDVKLDKYMENKIFRGVRNILEGEPDDWLGREAVHRGLGIIIIIIIIIIIVIIIIIITSRTKGLITYFSGEWYLENFEILRAGIIAKYYVQVMLLKRPFLLRLKKTNTGVYVRNNLFTPMEELTGFCETSTNHSRQTT